MVENDTVYILYWAENREDDCIGRIGLAWSKDGINFKRDPEPVLYPEYDYEKMGCEDPRIVKFDKTWYLFYMANRESCKGIQIALASSKDLLHWKKLGFIKIKMGDWESEKIKAAVVCPEKINGKYVMYFLGQHKAWYTSIGVAFSADLIHWEEYANNPVVIPMANYSDSMGVDPGATPVMENDKITLIYNGWDEKKVHRTGNIEFREDNPVQVLERCEKPVIEPTKEWEIEGPVRNVPFAEGVVRFNIKWLLYYGAADKCIGLAEATAR